MISEFTFHAKTLVLLNQSNSADKTRAQWRQTFPCIVRFIDFLDIAISQLLTLCGLRPDNDRQRWLDAYLEPTLTWSIYIAKSSASLNYFGCSTKSRVHKCEGVGLHVPCSLLIFQASLCQDRDCWRHLPQKYDNVSRGLNHYAFDIRLSTVSLMQKDYRCLTVIFDWYKSIKYNGLTHRLSQLEYCHRYIMIQIKKTGCRFLDFVFYALPMRYFRSIHIS